MNAPTLEPEKPVRYARLATLKYIRDEMCPPYFAPLPSFRTIRRWLAIGKVPAFKTGAGTSSGGGPIYYRSADVERWLRKRAGL